MDYEYHPREWVGADTRHVILAELLRQARTIAAELHAETGSKDHTKLVTYLGWSAATVNRLKEAS